MDEECIILVTDDELQLPILTADTLQELADILGCKRNTVYKAAKNHTSVRLPKGRFGSHRKGKVICVNLSESED